MKTHIMKLVVGCHSIEDLALWQASQYTEYKGRQVGFVLTRYAPKRADEILESGGSIYRVINGLMCCRQKIVGFDSVDTSMGKKSLILTETEIVRVQATKRKAFQGWRYLKESDAPKDVGVYDDSQPEPASEMEAELRELGLI